MSSSPSAKVFAAWPNAPQTGDVAAAGLHGQDLAAQAGSSGLLLPNAQTGLDLPAMEPPLSLKLQWQRQD
jgi:hypothetical protein